MRKKIALKLLAFVIFLTPMISIFAAQKFPHLCRVSGLHFERASLFMFSQHTSKPRMYVITNISAHPIWLVHEKKHPDVSAGWDSQLFPKHWSAILVTRKNFSFSCHYQNKSGAMKVVPCKYVVRACQYSDFYSKNPVQGGFWVAENLQFKVLDSHIRARGFWLPKNEAKNK